MKKITGLLGRIRPRAAISLLLCIALMVGMVPGSLFVKADAATETTVTQDKTEENRTLDLVLWLDANNNTGKGTHDGNATKWVNLANTTQTIDVTDHVWGKDAEHGSYYLSMKDGYIILPDEVRQAIGSGEFTIEYVMEDFIGDPANTGSAIVNIMALTGSDDWIATTTTKGGTPNDNFVIYQHKGGNVFFKINSGDTRANVSGSVAGQGTNALTFKVGSSTNWYQNATLKSTSATVYKKAPSVDTCDLIPEAGTPQVIFGAATDTVSSRAFAGKVKAIRVYKGILTEDEIKQNSDYDQAHYYNTANATAKTAIPGGENTTYATDGLVLFLDANKNNGTSYDANATQWVNLVNLAESVGTNGHKFGTEGNYLNIVDGYIKLPDSVRQAIASGKFTIEFVMDDYAGDPQHTTGGIANIMAVTDSNKWIESVTTPGKTPNDNFVIYQNNNSGTIYFKTNSTPTWDKRVTVNGGIDKVTQSLVYNAGTFTWYQGAQSKGTSSAYNANPDVGAGYQVVFGACLDTVADRAFEGKVKAIRVYNKVLAEAEIAANAAADKAYYYHVCEAADQWSTDSGAHWHECTVPHCSINASSEKNGYGEHVYDNDFDTTCNTCGYTRTVTVTNAVPDGYVSDGLVLYLDANNNTGTGYNANSTTWTNLANLAQSVAVNGQSWGTDADYTSNYLDFTNNYIILPEEVRQAIGGENFTIEFVMDDFTSSDASNIINVMAVTGDDAWIAAQNGAGNTPNDNFVLFIGKGGTELNFRTRYGASWATTATTGNYDYTCVNSADVEGKTNTITFDWVGKSLWYLNGEKVADEVTNSGISKIGVDGFQTNPNAATKVEREGTWQTERKPQVIFGAACDTVSGRSFDANVKAIRIYNRTLSADEAAKNAAADKTRYYTEVNKTIAVPDGYVTDNLVFFVDANLNTGTGFDANATEWVDLTDSTGGTVVKTNKFTSWGTGDFNTGYLTINDGYIILPEEVRQAIASGVFTIEFLMEDYEGDPKHTSSGISNIMALAGSDRYIAANASENPSGDARNDNFVIYQYEDGSAIYFKTNSKPSEGSRVTVSGGINDKTQTLTYNSGSFIWYQDGASANSGSGYDAKPDVATFPGAQTGEVPQVIFGAAVDTVKNRTFTGKVKAIRIYSDILTADEALQNATTDYNRYYTDPDADHNHVWDTEWTQTATEHYQTCTVDGCDTKRHQGIHDYSNVDDASCNTCGYVRPIKSVAASYDVDIYEPVTDVNTAPIIMQMATEATKNVSGQAKRPSALIFDLKLKGGVLTAYEYKGTAELGTWADMYAANYGKANLGVRISDMDTATALANWAETEKVGNLWVISNDVEMIKTVTDKQPLARGVVDFTGDSVRGPANIKYNFDNDGTAGMNTAVGGDYAKNATRTYDWKTYTKDEKASVYENMDWADIYDLIFAEGYRTIIIPEDVATNDHIYFLQGSLVYTIVETDATTAEEYYDLIVGGANGIIAPDYAIYIDVLEGDLFKTGENTLVRGGSIVGHRGDMGYAVKGQKTVPENSIESIVSAAQSGASSVEFDMYMTLDGELVLNHNESIAGYFTYGPNTPENIARVADSVSIKARYWYGDLEYMVSTYNSEIPLQRLQDLYEAVDTEYPELRLHHEIKDSRVENLNRTIELMDKYGLRDRSDMMCFNKGTVAYTSSMGISSQYLSSVSKHGDSDRAYTMENQYRPLNSTWHATWTDICSSSTTNTEFLEEMKHFGQTAYPWPTSDVNTQAAYYVAGYQGFTTNIPHNTDDFIRELVLNYDSTTGLFSATASTLADHKMGTEPTRSQFVGSDYKVVTLPEYLEKWWIEKGKATGNNQYEITGENLKVVILEGAENITVDNDAITRTPAQTGKATVAVRYLQKIGNSTYYTYSKAVEITAPLYDHTHSWSTTKWEYNDTHHWHPCETAGCRITEPADMDSYAAHVYADDNDFTCDCGYTRTISRVSDEYVTDGLILFLDANNNVATGAHDGDSEVWVNLANIAQQITLPDGSDLSTLNSAWGEDTEHGAYYLDLNGYIKLPASVLETIASGEFTIEFLMDDFDAIPDSGSTAGGCQNIMTLTGSDAWIAAQTATSGTKNDNFVIYQNAWESTVNFKINVDGKPRAQVQAATIDDVTNTITFKVGSKANWYQDAVHKSTSNDTYSVGPNVADWAGSTPQVLFGAAVDVVTNRHFQAQVKAIRIYDRVLTEAELARNAEADQNNYYADPNAETGVPAGYETDGLVVFLDGINNTGKGYHSSYVDEWVNLVNNSELGTFLTGGSNSYVWTEDGLTVNGGVILPASALAAVAGANFTVEFYIENFDPAYSENGVVENVIVLIGPDGSVAGKNGGVWDDDFVSFQNPSSHDWNRDYLCFDVKDTDSKAFGRVSVLATSVNDVTNAWAFDSAKSITWYQNGVSKSASTGGASANWKTGIDLTNGTRLLFGAASPYMSARSFYGEIKAIRIYNRTLSTDELKTHSVLDTIRYSDVDVNAVAQESWDNVVGNTGELDANTTLTGIQAYAQSQLTMPNIVSVEVTDAGNGAYTFTYKLIATGEVIDTHTFYVDTEYTIVMGDLTADEQAELLNDAVKFQGSSGNVITVKWDDESDALYYKGTDDSVRPVTHLYFPAYISGEAYVYEAEVGFDSYGGWSTMAFAAENFENHYQYAFWGNMTSTGAEFVRHQTKVGTTWAVGHSNITKDTVADLLGAERMAALYNNVSGNYQVKDTVTYKVIVHNGILYGFIDGVQVLTTVATGTIYKDFNGVFGFNTSSSALNIHSISVRPITAANEEQEMAGVKKGFNPVKSYDVDIYEPDTDINTAPIVMQTAIVGTTDVSGEAKRPSAIIFDLKVENGVLNAYDGDTLLGTFADLYRVNQPKANVGVRIAAGDKETANALIIEAKELSAGNLWLISSDVEILNIVTDELPIIRGVVDFTGDTVRGPGNIRYSFDTDGSGTVDEKNEVINAALGQYKVIGGEYADKTAPTYDWVTYSGGYDKLTWDQMYDILMTCGYRTAIIPESAATKDHVFFLQGSMVYTIVETDATTKAEFYDLITTGVNGILSTAYDVNIAALESDLFDVNGEEIVIRGGGIVGHRGDMGNAVKGGTSLPENSIEAIVSSAQSGASSVEFDMYMTLDGYLVLNHNPSIKGYYDYGPNTPDDVVRVSADTTIVNRYWKGDLEYMVSTYNPNIPLQQLYQLYEAVDTEYPELRLHHELKDTRVETINRTIELMEKYGLRSRSDLMCSNYSILLYTSSMGISTQSIGMYSNKDTENRIYAAEANYRPINSTWHTQWTYINTDYLEELKHFGETAYPWATYSSTYAGYYVQGYQGFTTDAPHHTDDIIRELIPVLDPATGKVTVTARTLAYHKKGVFNDQTISGEKPITLPDYLQDYWVDKGYSTGIREYDLTGFEIIVISGNPVVDKENMTVTGTSENDRVAVRYKQTLTESGGQSYSFWIYSESFSASVPQTVTFEGNVTEKTVTYGDEAFTVKATSSGTGTITYTSSDPAVVTVNPTTGEVTIIGAGTATITATAAATGSYVEGQASYTLTVKRKVITASDVELTGTLTYTGEEQTQQIAVADGITYSVTGNEATDAGDYQLTVTGTGNYTGEVKLAWSIGKRSVTLTSATDTKIYDGTALTNNEVTVGGDGFVDGEGVTYDVTGSQTDKGSSTNTFTYTLKEGTKADNYSITTVNGTLTVTPVTDKVTVTITEHSGSVVYNGTEKIVTGYDVVIDNALYTVADFAFSGNSSVKGTNAGTYEMELKASDFANISTNFANVEFVIVDGKLEISKAELTVTAKDKTITYGDDPANNGVSYGGFVNGENERVLGGTLAYTYDYRKYDNVGEYKITPSGLTSGNYEISYVDGALTVAKKALTITAEAKGKTYGDADPELTYVVDGLVGNDTLTGALTRVAGENVGTYAIQQGTLAASDNYTVTYVGANLTISKKALAVTANNKTITYGDDPTNDGVTYVGFVTGEDESVLGGTLAYTYSYQQYGNVGAYVIMPSGLTSDNYEIAFRPGILTVTKKALTITAEAKSKTYGEVDPELTYTVEGLVNNDTLTGALSREEGENVGTYAIQQDTLAASDNYSVTYVGADLTINKKALTITANDKTITYGDAPANDGVTYDGFVFDEDEGVLNGTLAYTYSYKQYDDVGTYTITVSGLTSGNYDITFVDGTLTVNKKALTITAKDAAITYGDAPINNGVTYVGFVTGEDESVLTGELTYTYGYEQYGDAGTYAITPGGLDAVNYEIAYVDGTLTVNKKAAHITVVNKVVMITFPAPDLSNPAVDKDYTVTGLLSGDTVDLVVLTCNPDMHRAGAYAILASAEDANYTFTYTHGKLVVAAGSYDPFAGGSVPGGGTVICNCHKFSDVNVNLWYHTAVCYAVNNGIMNGTGNGTTFSPYLNLSRAMLMTMLARLDGVNTMGGATWYAKGMEWAVENGISDGTNPNADITREQMVTMLYRYADSPVVIGNYLAGYPDSGKISSWAKDAMNWAVATGVIQGNEKGELNPQGTATRAEVAQILYNYLNK